MTTVRNFKSMKNTKLLSSFLKETILGDRPESLTYIIHVFYHMKIFLSDPILLTVELFTSKFLIFLLQISHLVYDLVHVSTGPSTSLSYEQ